MFKFESANHRTFADYVVGVLATFALMWFSMLAAFALFTMLGLASIDFSGGLPVFGAWAIYFLGSPNLTSGQQLVSTFAVLGVFFVVVAAPFLEEILFRWFPCGAASEENGNIKPRWGKPLVLSLSFVLFGMAHGNGYFSIMVQGVGGLWLALLFFRNGPNTTVAYLSCVAAHSLYNTSVLTTAWLMG